MLNLFRTRTNDTPAAPGCRTLVVEEMDLATPEEARTARIADAIVSATAGVTNHLDVTYAAVRLRTPNGGPVLGERQSFLGVFIESDAELVATRLGALLGGEVTKLHRVWQVTVGADYV